tara:strand:- start:3820 stop:4200 length:381 start_codon:yes stop_codon:yes gene_type:complete
MAINTTTVTATGAAKMVVNTDTDESEDLATNAAANLQMIEINNTANATVFYLQLWDVNSAGSVACGTNEPDYVIPCPASAKINYVIPQDITFSAGIVMAGTTNLAACSYSPAGPSATVRVTFLLAS